jgi:hypothetical protein
VIDIKSIFGNDYSEFCEVDPFNVKNKVEGYISRKPNQYYGALVITKVNNKEVEPQLVMATPKMYYPFDAQEDGKRNYHFPSAKSIEVYTKLDGTNILSYFYYFNDYRFLTFKTRLRPFLSSSKFGDFYTMWNEVAKDYFNEIKKKMIEKNCNLSFELFGARNPHLIAYKNSLDFVLLFGVTNVGNILSPKDLAIDTLPNVEFCGKIDRDYVWNYEENQKKLEASLVKQEGEYYTGDEGAVWYLKTLDNRTLQLKCKPGTIEAIHFSAGAGGLGKNTIIATVWNALENTDDLTIEFVKQLLLEEFKPEVIEAKTYLIQECIEYVKNESEFRHKVLEDYKTIGININLDKRSVMRQISTKYPKDKMGKVYSIIVSLG